MDKYRPNVGIVVFNKDKKVLLCRRKGMAVAPLSWQFPQGGIESSEDVITAGLRELKEETSLVSVRFVAKHDKLLRYDFPKGTPPFYGNGGKDRYIGQEQTWILLYFYGNDDEINLCTKEPEFSDYQWSTFDNATKKVWSAKRAVYKQVQSFFEPLVADF